ncbi:MAG: hypothetical protein IAE97_14550 [Chthoniobacterales bacterium]|nr:hypothetical protein [Chthoniobacterales bacterium]
MNTPLLLLVFLLPTISTAGPHPPQSATDVSQPIPDQIQIPDAPATARVLEPFQRIQPEMSMVDVARLCGIPDEHHGSGIFIFIYRLQDGSTVAIGTGDLEHLLYANHIAVWGKVTALIPSQSSRPWQHRCFQIGRPVWRSPITSRRLSVPQIP